ncbi:MAG: polysaccharide deacetylase family protein [Saprospiraceae bacterium]
MIRKKVYLTIDDSPSSSFLEKMDYLEGKKIPTIFFCIGQLMEKRESMMIDCIQRGFQVANHSYSHPHFSKISLDQCKYEIEKTDGIIENIYSKAGRSRKYNWFRFPYGDKGDLKNGAIFNYKKPANFTRKNFIQDVLKSLNYTQPDWENINYSFVKKSKIFEDLDWHWTFDIMEWATREYRPTFGIKNLYKINQRLNSSNPKDCRGKLGNENRWLNSDNDEIILLHDHEETTPIFNSIIDALKELPLSFEGIK